MAKINKPKVTVLTFDFNESEDTKIYEAVRILLREKGWYHSLKKTRYKEYGCEELQEGSFNMPTTTFISVEATPEMAISQFEEALNAFADQEGVKDIACYTGARAIAFCNNEYLAFLLRKKG